MPPAKPRLGSPLAWTIVVLAGCIAPACALFWLGSGAVAAPLALVVGSIVALGLMGSGMIAAAVAGRLLIGIGLALFVGFAMLVLAGALELSGVPDPIAAGLAMLVASISFAARGALFARSAEDKGWWIAVSVFAGEAAMLVTASVAPGSLPDWLLALLPAQWASAAMRTALGGAGTALACSELLALAGTAAATLLVARLWPRRWPYLIMFTTWLALSALVWHRPAPPTPSSGDAAVVADVSDPAPRAAPAGDARRI